MEGKPLHVVYFSMEMAFKDEFKNFAGGLGVLAADAMYSFADLGIQGAGITLWYHQDDDKGKALMPPPSMRKREETVEIQIEDRKVKIIIWQMDITGKNGHTVPVFFLSSYTPENSKWDRDLSKHLYASDRYTRLGQEAILGIGGYRALKKMGYGPIDFYHMNEGHVALIGLERLRSNGFNEDIVRSKSTFTTHTPIPAGHDYFDYHLAQDTLGNIIPANIKSLATQDSLGMTQLAMNLSCKTNSVSKRHQEVTSMMFPGYTIENVTNGIYHPRWVGNALKDVYTRFLPGWEQNPLAFENVKNIPNQELIDAVHKQKKSLVDWINANPAWFNLPNILKEDLFDEQTLTIGFARRFVPYKRPGLIFHNLDKLRAVGYKKLQIVFAGKCHSDDMFCNRLRDNIAHYSSELRGQVKVVMVPDYNLDIAKHLVTGCDVWLNNPIPPREASGTSGMKAALNGGINLSILDGWWIEGFERNPMAGWGFGGSTHESDFGDRDNQDATELMNHLQDVINCYYDKKEDWVERMKAAISLIAYFNTDRMVQEYNEKIWLNKPK
jgi:starch phosphorylase